MRKYLVILMLIFISSNSFSQTISLNLKFDGTLTSQSYSEYYGYIFGAQYLGEGNNFGIGTYLSYANTTLALEKTPINERGGINTFLLGASIFYFPFSKFKIRKISVNPQLSLDIGYDLGNYTNYSGNISDYNGKISKITKSPRFGLNLGLIFQPSNRIYVVFEVGYEIRNLKLVYEKNITPSEIVSQEKNINLNTGKFKIGLLFPL